ncbi:MAG: metallophosphoesterase [Alphaproteobacteria bacterium]
MTLWLIILWTVILFLGLSFTYLSFRIPAFFDLAGIAGWSKTKSFLLGSLITFGFMGMITLCLDFINAVICTLYLALIWISSDFIFMLIQKTMHVTFKHYYAGWMALGITALALIGGWYADHGVWQTNYHLTTSKKISPLKIALIADAHLGTTFDEKGFEKHLQTIQAQEPDLLVVAGDYVDDDTTRPQMIEASRALGQVKTKYGVYFVLGNHDKGYYGSARRGFSAQELIEQLTKNNVKVLRDEAVLVDNSFYVIGRCDFSEVKEQGGHRKSMTELVSDLDKNKYMIVLDHQPADFENQAEAQVDLVLSGHTHGGQLFPFNQVGKWIGANDLVYGHERRNKTDFIVTSGISAWGIKFKTGTKSEFVLIQVESEK